MSRARPGAGMRSSFLASTRLSPVPDADDGTAIPALSRRFILATSAVHTVAADAVPANISDSIANAALREVFMFCLEFVVTAASVDGAD